MSHWWQQGGHLPKIAPIDEQKSYLGSTSEPLNKGVNGIKFR